MDDEFKKISPDSLDDLIDSLSKEEAIVFINPSYKDSLVCISKDGRAIYSYKLLVNSLIEEDGMTCDEAIEFIDYNIFRALPYFGSKAPIIMMDTLL